MLTATTSRIDPTVQGALDVVRRAKSQNEVDFAFQHVLKFISSSSSTLKTAPCSPLSSSEEKEVVLSISILAGALCRRVEQLIRVQTINTAYEAEPNEDASLVFQRRIETLMDSLWDVLDPLRTRLRECTRATQQKPPTTAAPSCSPSSASLRGSGLLSTPASLSAADVLLDIMSYGMGELCDYYTGRFAEVQQSLTSTLRHPRWEVRKVVDRIVALQRLEERSAVVPRTLPPPPLARKGMPTQGNVTAVTTTSPLRDPLSRLPLQLPARGPHCTHLDLFELPSLVQAAQQQLQQPRQSSSPSSSPVAGAAQRARATAAVAEVACPICRSTFELYEARVDTEARAALHTFYQAHPIETLDVDAFCLAWSSSDQTVNVVARTRRGEKRVVSVLEEDEDAAPDNGTARKAPRLED